MVSNATDSSSTRAVPPPALRVGSVLGQTAGAERFARAHRPAAFVFPRDHGPHERFRSEWWYFTAALEDHAGRRYGVQFTVFRHALTPSPSSDNLWQTGQVYLGHLAVTDVAGGTHTEAERLARGHPALAGAQAEPFAAWVDGWRLASRGTDLLPARLQAHDASVGLDLLLSAVGAKPIARQGEAGFSAKGPTDASYYYSVPRIPVSGRVVLDGREVEVEGLGWLDREWSTSVLRQDLVGWDWLGLHLDDGVDLMLFRLRRADGRRDPYDAGVLIDAQGAVMPLAAKDFELRPQRHWTDEADRRWPVGWRISCEPCGGDLLVEATVDDQRMDTMLIYWEGAPPPMPLYLS